MFGPWFSCVNCETNLPRIPAETWATLFAMLNFALKLSIVPHSLSLSFGANSAYSFESARVGLYESCQYG